jgi:hypothetical protein
MSDEAVPHARIAGASPPADGKRLWRTGWIAVGVGGGAWLVTINPIGGSLFIAAVGGWTGWRRRARRRWARKWSDDITELARRINAGAFDDAETLLRARWRISTNSVGRAILSYYHGQLCWTRGKLEAALDGFVACTRLLPRPVTGFERGHWHARFAIANLQLELGLLHLAEASCTRAFEAPDWPELRVWRTGLETHHAFAHDRPDELGDATQLAPRAIVARGGQQGLVMAVIAWAYEARGSLETAASLRDEARGWLARNPDFWRVLYPHTWARLAPQLDLDA